MVSYCATNPATCEKKYGSVLADSLIVREAIDRAMGEKLPLKMIYDLSALVMIQRDAEGFVSSTEFAQGLQAQFGWGAEKSELVAGAALGALGGIGKASKSKYQLNPSSADAKGGGAKGITKASETIGQPVEAVIGGRKRLLRVDIEPNGKLQIQSGGGKDSIVDFRPELSKPLAPQINTAFKRLPQSARDQLVKNAEKGLKRLQEAGNI